MAEEKEIQLPSEYYQSRVSDRKPFEDRAEEFAKVTIPALFRATGSGGADKLPRNYVQSLGAKLVKNLSSKITLTLFPPSASGFKLSPDAKAMKELTGGDKNMMTIINKDLSLGADVINKEIERQDIRKHVFNLVDHQIVIGSCIMEKVPNNGIKIHGLKTIAFTLDDMGEAMDMCVVEELLVLPESLRGEMEDSKDSYELYTRCRYDYDMKKWEVTQELDGVIVGEAKYYNDKNVPFSYQGMIWNVGEKAHRPFVEDYYGSLNSYNVLSKLLTQGAVVAAKTVLFVDERGGRTRKKDVSESANGDVIDGRSDDVTSLVLGKNYDFQVPMQVRAEFRDELEEAFLSKNSITRQAERVTAEEIREMAKELESAMAGVYAVISNRITKRIVTWVMEELGIKFDNIDVSIITGLNALGMSNEIVKLDGMVTRLGQLELTDYLNNDELIDRYASGYGVNTVNLIKTSQVVAEERQKAQEAAMMNQVGQAGAETLGAEAGKKLVNGGQQQ